MSTAFCEVPLTKGQIAIIDLQDLPEISKYKWTAVQKGKVFYAARNSQVDGKDYLLYMHRFLMGLSKGDKRQVDHANMNTLDNRRSNIRICTVVQNRQNKKKIQYRGKSSSKYKGVHFYKATSRWQAYLKINGKQTFLGYFDSEVEAARAYDRNAAQHFGQFARLNFQEAA